MRIFYILPDIKVAYSKNKVPLQVYSKVFFFSLRVSLEGAEVLGMSNTGAEGMMLPC